MTSQDAVPAQRRCITRAEFAASLASLERRIALAIAHAKFDLGEIGTGATLEHVKLHLEQAQSRLKSAIDGFEARRQARRIARR